MVFFGGAGLEEETFGFFGGAGLGMEGALRLVETTEAGEVEDWSAVEKSSARSAIFF